LGASRAAEPHITFCVSFSWPVPWRVSRAHSIVVRSGRLDALLGQLDERAREQMFGGEDGDLRSPAEVFGFLHGTGAVLAHRDFGRHQPISSG